MDIIKEVENHVYDKYDHDKYNWYHNEFVTKYAIILAEKLGADVEIVRIAARFHDIDYSRGSENHTHDSAEYASKFLEDLGYPKDRIKKVRKAILCHTSSVIKTIDNPNKEGKILFDADKMWTMTPMGFARTIAHRYKNNTSFSFICNKLEKAINKFNKLHFDESRKLIQDQRKICIQFLRGMKNETNNSY